MIPPATPKIYFENSTGRVLEHPDGFVIFQYHSGPRTFHHLQALLTHTRNLLTRRGWHRMLGDQRLMAPFTEEESLWIVNHWLDPAQQGPRGLYGAILLAPDEFARLPSAQALQEAKAGALTYRVFASEESAVAWLTQVA
ncbi:hypothetical protein [Hymenobacter sp. B1770]|uniref:hypothetical protein n=1 Tax=Hymenobacter sp. B1770 TaxID=1718788 RepID=UPI003CE6AC6D